MAETRIRAAGMLGIESDPEITFCNANSGRARWSGSSKWDSINNQHVKAGAVTRLWTDPNFQTRRHLGNSV